MGSSDDSESSTENEYTDEIPARNNPAPVTYDEFGRPNPKLESGQSLTAPIPEGIIVDDISGLPRATQEGNTARGVLIDDTE